MSRTNLFELSAKIGLDTSEYESGVENVTKSGSSLASKLKSGLGTAAKAVGAGIAAVGTAATAAVGGLLALESSTEEYRAAMGRLNTAFETAGYSAETAQQAYTDFYGILGDTDTATEASQLLAQLAENEEDVATWTNIAAGVNGTFGDSLPIEGLIEAANETANTATVTGVLADALNWVGISEDEFNEKLAACSSESERNQLIMETLANQYDDAADAFYENNEALVQARENQARLDEVMGNLGETVSKIKNAVLADFIPSIADMGDALNDMLNGVEGADEAFGEAIGSFVSNAVERLPEFLNLGVQIISSLASGVIQAIPTVVAALPQLVAQMGQALMTLAPQILQMGGQILTELANGIIQYVPQMVTQLPTIITEFVNFISSQLPTILQQGTQLLNEFVNGIIGAIPTLVSSLPQVISAIVDFVTSNLPTIVQSGIDILTNLIEGIIGAIPDLVAALPQIIDAIVNGISAMLGSIVDVGRMIVEGIWQGITNAGSWLVGKITGWFNGVVNSVKNFLGIASPSKLFEDEIGANMALGIGEGWDDEYDRVRRRIEDDMNFGTANVDFSASGLGQSSARMHSALTNMAATMGQNFTITVQSVLDGKVIGETAYKYSRNKQRAYGV